MDDGRVSSTSDRSLCGKMKASRSRLSPTEHPVDELSELEFRAHFYIPNSVSIQLIGRETSSTDGISQNMIYFANEQFAARFHFPILSYPSNYCNFLKSYLLSSILMLFGFWWDVAFWTCYINWISFYWRSFLFIPSRLVLKSGSACQLTLHLCNLCSASLTQTKVGLKDMCWCPTCRVLQLRDRIKSSNQNTSLNCQV